MSCGIYCIENLINGKKYIGQSVTLEERSKGYHKGSIPLNFAIEKYGKKNFKRYPVLCCEMEELDYYEIECIKIFHSRVSEWGYNIQEGGGGTRGRIVTKETRKKLSIASSGKNNPMYGKQSAMYGRKHNSKTIEKMSLSAIGRKSKKATSKYHGVFKEEDSGKWRVGFVSSRLMSPNRKHINLGKYKKEIDAAKAYDKYIIENNLPNPLNFNH